MCDQLQCTISPLAEKVLEYLAVKGAPVTHVELMDHTGATYWQVYRATRALRAAGLVWSQLQWAGNGQYPVKIDGAYRTWLILFLPPADMLGTPDAITSFFDPRRNGNGHRGAGTSESEVTS